MSIRSIFLLFYAFINGNAQLSSFDSTQASKLYKSILESKTLFHTSSNNSTGALMYLKSFNPLIKVNGISFSLVPESIGYASYDHPQAIDLTKYNQSCLTSWAKKYNNSINKCLSAFNERTTAAELFCKASKKPYSDECDIYRMSNWKCAKSVNELGGRMNEIVFPDGRSVDSLIWNCPSDMTCSEFNCIHPLPPPIYTYYPITTTRSPLESARDILSILLKVCIISSVVCALLSFFIRYYAYLHRRAQIQSDFLSQSGPTPPKTEYTSFPPPTISYHPPHAPPMYNSNPISEPPPPYIPPPPYTERPVEPLPKVT